MAYYTPTLDNLLKSGKITKVPYEQKSGRWIPRVGDQCWNYQRDNMYTVVSVHASSGKCILRWGFDDDYETIDVKNTPSANLVFRNWEFDLEKLLTEYDGNIMNIVYTKENQENGKKPVSIKGAEIKMLSMLGLIPQPYLSTIEREYIFNTANHKINDIVYYYLRSSREDLGIYMVPSSITLIRDLEKSPRRYGNENDAQKIPTEAVASSFTGNNLVDCIIQEQTDAPKELANKISRSQSFWRKVFNIFTIHRDKTLV